MSRGEFFVKIRGFREDFLGEIVLFDLVGSPRSVFEKFKLILGSLRLIAALKPDFVLFQSVS